MSIVGEECGVKHYEDEAGHNNCWNNENGGTKKFSAKESKEEANEDENGSEKILELLDELFKRIEGVERASQRTGLACMVGSTTIISDQISSSGIDGIFITCLGHT